MENSGLKYQELLEENERLKNQLNQSNINNSLFTFLKEELPADSSNNLFKLVFETAKIGLAILDNQGNFLECNPRLTEITGYSKEELSNMHFGQITHPDDSYLDKKFFSETHSGKTDHFVTEKRYINKFGEIIWVNLQVNIIRDDKGNFKYSVSATEDITEQKKLKLVEDIILGFNAQFEELNIDEILKVSLEAAEKLTGSKIGFFHFVNPQTQELILKTWSENSIKRFKNYDLSFDTSTFNSEAWNNFIKSKKTILIDDFQTNSNKYDFFNVYLPFDNLMISPAIENTKIVAILGVGNKSAIYKDLDSKILSLFVSNIWEIIRRKRTEEELSESEYNFRSFFNSINDLVFILDEESIILEVNQKLVNLLEYSREELIGKSALILYQQNQNDEASIFLNTIIKRKSGKSNLPLCSKKGKLIPVQTTVSKGHWNSQEVFYFECKDISTLKYTEAKFSKVFHVNPAICALIDLQTESFLEVNKTFCQKLNYQPNEVIGILATEILKIDNRTREHIYKKFIENDRLSNFDINLMSKSGELLSVLLSGEIIVLQGKKYLYAVALDISDRKETQERLRVSEHQLKEAENIAQMGNYVFNIETGYWSNSKNLDKIYGIDKDYIRDFDGWLNIIHPDFREELSKYWKENILIKHQNFDKEYKIVNIRDGKEKWVHGKGILRFTEDGQLNKMVGTIQDITKRKNAELKLEERENALRKIIESTIGKGGKDFFDSMVLSLQQITKADFTYIAEYTRDKNIKTISICQGEKIIDNIIYSLPNSPCEQVFNKQTQVYAEKVAQLFSKDELLFDLGIVAYAGTPVFDHSGNPIGIIVSLFKNSIKDSNFIRSIFEICSTSIGSEIQRTKSEIRSKENELTLHIVFDNAPVMMVLLDENAEILNLNKAGQNIYNYENDHILGNRSDGLMNCFRKINDKDDCGNHPDCSNCLLRYTFLSTLKTGEQIFKLETEFNTSHQGKDFTYTFLLSSSRVELDGKYMVLLSIDDITERKKMEETILQNEYTLNKIFDSAPVVMMLLNEKSQIVKLNKIGYDFHSFKLNTSNYFLCGDILNCANPNNDNLRSSKLCTNCNIGSIIEETLKTGKEIHKKEADIISIINKEMVIKTYLVSASLIENISDKKVLLTLDDITERKRVDEELIFSNEIAVYNEQRYRLLSNITFEGIMLYKERTIIDVNRALSKMSGYTYDELIGQHSMSFLFPSEYKSFFELKLTEEYSTPYETVLICKNGSRIPVEIESRYFNHNNERIRVSAIRDITERKLGEKKILQAIVQTEENERARLAQELHDGLGPILSNVQMYFQWLAEADDNSEFVIDKGNISLKNAFSTLREISNNLSPHILHNFGISYALTNFIETIALKNVIVNFKSNIEKVRFDNNIEIALYRVVTELINNSIKHSSAKNIDIDMQLENNLFRTLYHDNGKGFDIKNTLQNSKGFGMINIQNRIKAIQGSISISSEYNEGFTVEIKVFII